MTAPEQGHNQGLDFFLPMQTRKWLALLCEDQATAYRIRPGLDLGPDYMGFAFRSNGLGLRGPDNTHAPNVLLGTSFAMGFAVDHGLDWHHGLLAPDRWLSLALPVGPQQLETLMAGLYRGEPDTALVVFHPNFWTHARQYGLWAESGLGVFDFFRWTTDREACFRMQLAAQQRRARKVAEGRAVSFAAHGVTWYMDADRDRFDFMEHRVWYQRGAEALERMLRPFRRVVAVRAPVKVQACPQRLLTEHCRRTLRNYDLGWALLTDRLSRLAGAEVHDPGPFDLEQFHPLDIHWNAAGNARFASFTAPLLR